MRVVVYDDYIRHICACISENNLHTEIHFLPFVTISQMVIEYCSNFKSNGMLNIFLTKICICSFRCVANIEFTDM